MSYLGTQKDRLLFLPLGGCGEIGMNLNLYGCDGRWLMVDLGMTFGDPSVPGVDLMFPDTGFIEEEKDDLIGLVLTHGHEDHIGAVPYLWSRFRCPVYATPFTAELVRLKLAEAGLEGEVPLHIVHPNQVLELGPFKVTYIPLAHSIAEGHGLAIETRHGTLFHTGDWKVDDRPLIGPICPSDRLKQLGDKGVLALVGDSTNVFNAHASGSEDDVRQNLIELVKTLTGRVIITTFASNVARLQTIGDIAMATGRSLALVGRSMHRIFDAAQTTGYLEKFPAFVDEADLDDIPADKSLIACTGCQGEYRAALARMARGEHRSIHLRAGDTVIFSSKIIPGNEIELGRVFNDLAALDVNVITEKDAFIHVSGHPGRAELQQMFSWTRPLTVIPVHGEERHIRRHADFARECGVKHTVRPRNGDVIEISTDGARKIDEVPVGRLALDGNTIVSLDSEAIVDRRRIMIQGLICVHLALDEDSCLVEEPLFQILGVPSMDDEMFYDGLVRAVEDALERMDSIQRGEDRALEEVTRIAVRRYTRREVGKNPAVRLLITRIDDLNLTSKG